MAQRAARRTAKTFCVSLTRFCLRNPIAVTLFYLFVLVVGFIALPAMGRSILPPLSIPLVTIAASYPDAAPQEMERLIVEPLEDQLDEIPDVDRVSASAQNGLAEIAVRFRFGSDVDVDRSNVQQAVDSARPNMPADLVPPAVSKDDPAQTPILEEAVSSAVLSPAALSEIVIQEVIPALRSTGGVGAVRSSGTLTRQFTIRPQIAPLNALGGTALDVLRAVAAGNDILPGGVLKSRFAESPIGIKSAAVSRAELEQLPLAIPGGTSVRLSDVARVDDTYADQTTMSRVDGNASAIVFLSHVQGADSIRTIHAARRTFAQLAERYPLVRFEQLRTDEPYTRAAVDGVLQTLGEGIGLTVLVMLLFLHAWRNALISAIAIPASLCAAFATMWALGFTINVLSLMGLALTIGILVDDSIVIVEAIARNAVRGLHGEEAALAGRKELGGAAFAITLVDVAVFAPIALTSGLVGEFMREFGLVIVFATAFSLLVSFTLTPLLAARWSVAHGGKRIRRAALPWTLRTALVQRIFAACRALVESFHACETRLIETYADRWLPAAMAHRRSVLSAAAAACMLSLLPLFLGAIPTEFSPPVNHGEAMVDLTFPAGTPLLRTDALALRLSNVLLQDAQVKHIEATSGRDFNGVTDIFATNVAELGIVLSDPGATGNNLVARVKQLAYLAPEASIAGAGKGMGGTAPISYTISGEPAAIDAASQRIAAALRENVYSTDVRTTNAGLGPRLQIEVDAQRARLLDVSTDDAAQTARIASGGTLATKARLPSGLVNVVIRSDATQSGNLDALERLTVRSGDSKLIPLGDLVRVIPMREPAVIERENRRRVVTVSANMVDDAPIGMVTSRMSKLLRAPNFLPPGAHIEPRGDLEQFLDTTGKMLAALALSIVVVYAILAVLYRSYALPLVIMLTVPLAAIGAFGALYVLNQPLNLYSMLGVIMLVGLVAKNGILLVEYAERAVREGAGAARAMREAARLRCRPILMTTLAMIAGMLPLALGHTIGGEYRRALGPVVIGGLSSSLFLTLLVVPVVYVAYRTAKHAEA